MHHQMYNVKCKTNEEIEASYPNIYLSMYVHKNLVDPSDYISPIKPAYIYSYFRIDLLNLARIDITYSSAELISDTGFLFKDLTKQDFLEFESINNMVEPINSSFSLFNSEVSFFISRGFKSYKRDYIRISDALANVGGILSLFQLVITFVFSFYLMLLILVSYRRNS